MNKNLRILMVAPQPFFSARGTPFSVLHRIRALLERGHSVDLVTYGYGEDIALEGLTTYRCSKLPFIDKVKIGPSIPKIFLDVLLYFKTRKLLKTNSYDVFHSHEEAAFFALSFGKKLNMPHLYDMHSSLPQQLSNFKAYNIGFIRKIFETLENKVLSSCDAVITICDDLGRIVDTGYPDKPHSMIENIGEDRKVFQANGVDWKTKLGIENQSVLLYTGTFEAYQGIDLFLEAMPAVIKTQPNTMALLVGGRDDQVQEYRMMSEQLGILDNVIFTGTVHPENIPNLIDLSTIIVSPRSRGTNTPLKIYNYLRTSKPLLATDRLTHTQILNPDIAHLVQADSASFADGIIKLLEDSAYATQVAERARIFAQEHFSDDSYLEMVNDIYEKMFADIG